MLSKTIFFSCLLLFTFLGTGHAQEGSVSDGDGTMNRSAIPLPPGQAEAARHADSIANAMPDGLMIAVDNNLPCNECRQCGQVSRRSRKMNRRFKFRNFAPRYAAKRRRCCR